MLKRSIESQVNVFRFGVSRLSVAQDDDIGVFVGDENKSVSVLYADIGGLRITIPPEVTARFYDR